MCIEFTEIEIGCDTPGCMFGICADCEKDAEKLRKNGENSCKCGCGAGELKFKTNDIPDDGSTDDIPDDGSTTHESRWGLWSFTTGVVDSVRRVFRL